MEEGLVRRDPGPNIRTSEQPNLLVEHLNIWNRSLGGACSCTVGGLSFLGPSIYLKSSWLRLLGARNNQLSTVRAQHFLRSPLFFLSFAVNSLSLRPLQTAKEGVVGKGFLSIHLGLRGSLKDMGH